MINHSGKQYGAPRIMVYAMLGLFVLIIWLCMCEIVYSQSVIVFSSPIAAGRVYVTGDANYADAKANTTGDVADNTTYQVGQINTDWVVIRSVWNVDLSNVSEDTMDIDSIRWDLDGSEDQSVTDFNQAFHIAYAYGALDVDDFDAFPGWSTTTLSPHRITDYTNSSTYLATYGNIFKCSASGQDSVIARFGSTLYTVFLSEEDENNSAPTGNEYITYDIAANKPKLEIYYTYIPPTGDILTGARGTIIREATGKELSDKTKRKQKYISKARKKGS